MPLRDVYGYDVEQDVLERGLRARVELMRITGEALVEEHRMQAARALLASGLTLVPSDHLLDNMFVVSRGVYEAARKLTEQT